MNVVLRYPHYRCVSVSVCCGDGNAGQSVNPPLWPRLKYIHNYISITLHSFGWHFCPKQLIIPAFKPCRMDCHDILYRHLWFPRDEAYWYWCSSDFCSSTTRRLIFLVLNKMSRKLLDQAFLIFQSDSRQFIRLPTAPSGDTKVFMQLFFTYATELCNTWKQSNIGTVNRR